MNKKYNEFIQLKSSAMAQAISDMTYLYEETEVPSTHYKKILEETIEEDIDEVVSYEMLNIYVKQLRHLYEENPCLFFQALMCIEEKIKPTDIRPKQQSQLRKVTCFFLENIKKVKLLNDKFYKIYNDEIIYLDNLDNKNNSLN